MRRVLAALLVLGIAAAATLTACGSKSDYELDAIFDNVAFLNEGQQVRIAGATVGSIEALSVTPDHKARVRMRIDPRFAPFHADADCTIQPQSLIGERFVQCVPGTAEAPPLAREDGTPTLPVAHTHAPVDLDLVLSTFNLPTRQRLGILLSSLGAGLAGNGQNLGAAIMRANPALQQTRHLLGVLNRDRSQLQTLVGDGDVVVHTLAARSDRVAAFVRNSADVVSQTAAHRAGLAESVRRLPAFLDQARPALDQLSAFARAGTPLMTGLRESGPGLAHLLQQTGTFAGRVRPALTRLSPVLAQTRAALPDVTPQIARLARFARSALPAGDLVAQLLASLKRQGAVDGFASFAYFASTAFSRFDRYSHLLPAYLIGSPCGVYVTTPTAGCSAKYPSYSAPATRRRAQPHRRRPARVRPHARPTPAATAQPVRTPVIRVPKLPALPPVQQTVNNLLDFLLTP
jgi:phospholipid/cholesterol/gamma-HCH transport system substrate-binding protein